MAVISPSGDVVDTGVIYPTFGKAADKSNRDKSVFVSMVSSHRVELISIGNGHGCRDVEKWVSGVLSGLPEQVRYTIVNEDGASIYRFGSISIGSSLDLVFDSIYLKIVSLVRFR